MDRASDPPADRPLSYPQLLADVGVEGEVLLRFAVDEQGRVDSTTIKPLRSTHDLFPRAARESVLGWRARPAERRGRPVRELTTHAFCFEVVGIGAVAGCGTQMAPFAAPSVTVACTEGGTTICSGSCGPPQAPRPPNVRCP